MSVESRKRSSESLVQRAIASILPIQWKESYQHCLCRGFAHIHSLRHECPCTGSHASCIPKFLSRYDMCIEALRLEPRSASSFLQLSRMVGSQGFTIPNEILKELPRSSSKRFNRQDLLIFAFHCDPYLPDIYDELACTLDNKEHTHVILKQKKFFRQDLQNTAHRLRNGDDSEQYEAEASLPSTNRIDSSQSIGSFFDSMQSDRKSHNMIHSRPTIKRKIRSKWVQDFDLERLFPANGPWIPSSKLVNIHRELDAAYSMQLKLIEDRTLEGNKDLYNAFEFVIEMSDGPEESIYRCLVLLEVDVPAASTDPTKWISDELKRNIGNVDGAYIPYFVDAEESLLEYYKLLKETQTSACADPYYLLAASVISRKVGNMKASSQLLTKFTEMIEFYDLKLEHLVNREKQLHAWAKTNSLETVRNGDDTQSSPPTSRFKDIGEEWEYEKKKLTIDMQMKMKPMDDIMQFIGLEQVSELI
jgi:hypothetical protein